ncbi:Coupling of ubiquitin conjugation to ER degradation protein 1 [Grifola frondosa]|uniref:Coupling of ubiquitin conjugation to ER degradation protein 1 n=1 Tax=Grifola frondosa TaxID=5627 RepID=A0A1C7ML16_GRIFR|nr:Coupling of ubiquitin conjugation to ER degradation protein 1 [Grifola frondosa]
MGEVVNVLVAVAVVVFIVRWATSSAYCLLCKIHIPDCSLLCRTYPGLFQMPPRAEKCDNRNGIIATTDATRSISSFNFRSKLYITCSQTFRGHDNIRYDLLRTGSVEHTSNKILERGFLPAPPPAYYTLYPRAVEPTASAASASSAYNPVAAKGKAKAENLLTRYNLQGLATGSSIGIAPEDAGGKAIWEESAEKREASLRERKARMILAARERLLAKQEASPS